MKKLILLLIVSMITFLGSSKETVDPNFNLPRNDEGKVEYKEVIEVPGVSKDELYLRAWEWLSKTFISSKNVIQMKDQEGGIIVGNATIQVSVKRVMMFPAGWINYTLTLNFKDGRYRCVINSFVHDGTGSEFSNGASAGPLTKDIPRKPKIFSKKEWARIKMQVDEEINKLIESMKAAMISDSDDEW